MKLVYTASSDWFSIAIREGLEVDWENVPEELMDEILLGADLDNTINPERRFGRLVKARPQDTELHTGDYVVQEESGCDYVFVRETDMPHVPGPWTYQVDGTSFKIRSTGEDWTNIASDPSYDDGSAVLYRAQIKANARLIASAPELLEALKSIANLAHLAWSDPSSVRGAFERIETLAIAAIAKATE